MEEQRDERGVFLTAGRPRRSSVVAEERREEKKVSLEAEESSRETARRELDLSERARVVSGDERT